VQLDVLPSDEAVGLLHALIGPRADAAPGAVAALAEQCAGLPLALRIAAELVGQRPGASLAKLAAELPSGQPPLDLLEAGDDARTSIRAVFSWSCSRLPGDAAQAFRLLGLHPGADLQAGALAALTGTALVAEAQHTLGVLVRANLVQQSATGRYSLHALLRAYAGELSAATDSSLHRRMALTRLLDHYLHTAAHAMDLLLHTRRQYRPDPAHLHPLATPLPDAVAARSWLEAERDNLMAVTGHSGLRDWPQHTIGLVQTVAHYLDNGSYLSEAPALSGAAPRPAVALRSASV
jgi:hypothetical protein